MSVAGSSIPEDFSRLLYEEFRRGEMFAEETISPTRESGDVPYKGVKKELRKISRRSKGNEAVKSSLRFAFLFGIHVVWESSMSLSGKAGRLGMNLSIDMQVELIKAIYQLPRVGRRKLYDISLMSHDHTRLWRSVYHGGLGVARIIHTLKDRDVSIFFSTNKEDSVLKIDLILELWRDNGICLQIKASMGHESTQIHILNGNLVAQKEHRDFWMGVEKFNDYVRGDWLAIYIFVGLKESEIDSLTGDDLQEKLCRIVDVLKAPNPPTDEGDKNGKEDHTS